MRKILSVAAVLLLMSVSFAKAEGKQTLTINGQTVDSVVTRITFEGESSWVKTTMLIIEK